MADKNIKLLTIKWSTRGQSWSVYNENKLLGKGKIYQSILRIQNIINRDPSKLIKSQILLDRIKKMCWNDKL